MKNYSPRQDDMILLPSFHLSCKIYSLAYVMNDLLLSLSAPDDYEKRIENPEK